jgi:hypothetical protein
MRIFMGMRTLFGIRPKAIYAILWQRNCQYFARAFRFGVGLSLKMKD